MHIFRQGWGLRLDMNKPSSHAVRSMVKLVTGDLYFDKDLNHTIEYQVESRTLKMAYYADEQWISFNRLIELM